MRDPHPDQRGGGACSTGSRVNEASSNLALDLVKVCCSEPDSEDRDTIPTAHASERSVSVMPKQGGKRVFLSFEYKRDHRMAQKLEKEARGRD